LHFDEQAASGFIGPKQLAETLPGRKLVVLFTLDVRSEGLQPAFEVRGTDSLEDSCSPISDFSIWPCNR
jgi:hypothetical protein